MRLMRERGVLERKIEALRERAAERKQKEKERVRPEEVVVLGQAQGKDG